MIKVMVCDDQAVVCDGLEMILDSDDEIQVVGKAYDGDRQLRLLRRLHPDLVLMDLKMPGTEWHPSYPNHHSALSPDQSLGFNHLW